MKRQKANEAETAVETEDVASATECTGLMPALPQDDAQAEASASLYALHHAGKGRRRSRRSI